MNDPTYRIDVTHDPHSALAWDARIHRLSDELQVGFVSAETRDGAALAARQWLAAERTRETASLTLFVDDDGRPVEGHSVKAS